jgi:hypothetical protein
MWNPSLVLAVPWTEPILCQPGTTTFTFPSRAFLPSSLLHKAQVNPEVMGSGTV